MVGLGEGDVSYEQGDPVRGYAEARTLSLRGGLQKALTYPWPPDGFCEWCCYRRGERPGYEPPCDERQPRWGLAPLATAQVDHLIRLRAFSQ